jgi:hypothetical protein
MESTSDDSSIEEPLVEGDKTRGEQRQVEKIKEKHIRAKKRQDIGLDEEPLDKILGACSLKSTTELPTNKDKDKDKNKDHDNGEDSDTTAKIKARRARHQRHKIPNTPTTNKQKSKTKGVIDQQALNLYDVIDGQTSRRNIDRLSEPCGGGGTIERARSESPPPKHKRKHKGQIKGESFGQCSTCSAKFCKRLGHKAKTNIDLRDITREIQNQGDVLTFDRDI